MRNGLVQMKYFCFCILIKRQYENSVILGSINQIAKKLNLSHHITSNQIKFGLKHGLLKKIDNGYLVVKYSNLFEFLQLEDNNYSFCRFGNFQELIERNLYIIARHNFAQQKYNIELKKQYQLVKKKVETGYYMSRKELKFFKDKNGVLQEKFTKGIITGQFHIANLLGISYGYAYTLLKKWAFLKLIEKETIYSKSFDRYEDNRLIRLDIGNYICEGSLIKSFV